MNDQLLQAISDDPIAAVAEYYASHLSDHPRAVEFVRDELKLTPEQAGEQRIGFADRTLGKHIPHRRVKRGRELRDKLVAAGLYKANGRETMRGRVTVPIQDDTTGKIVGLRGHKIDPHADGESIITISRAALAPVPDQDQSTNDTNRTNEEPELSASPATTDDSALTTQDSSLIAHFADRRYRIQGLEKNKSTCTLKVSLMVSRDQLVHLDSLDLVKARSRASFIKAASTELFVDADTIKKDIGRLLLKLETYQAERIAELKQPAKPLVEMTDADRDDALELLKDPNLLERIVADMDACGIVGESTGKLAGYLAATSRKLEKPLAIVIQSSSSAGKTSLMDAVLSMMPDEDVNRFSGMTGQSLFYLDSDSIRHKILAIAEDEGIRRSAYALKLLQSEGQLRHATVGRGEDGRSQTQEHHVEGPVQIFLTTTAMDIDEELVNRCLVLSVDESDSQTNLIQSKQREAFTSEFNHTDLLRVHLTKLHQNAQRLLEPIEVFNPYAPQLTFPTHKTRMRRDHVKYLTLINVIAFLHQHQRTIHESDVEGETCRHIDVTKRDIAVANGLAGELLGRSLDELAPQTRSLLGRIHEFIESQSRTLGIPRDAVRFTRRDLREAIHWSDSQVRKHLGRLVDLEYVLVHRGRNGQRYVYELLYAGEGHEGQPFLMGLIDPAKLKTPSPTTETLTPSRQTLTP